MKEQNRLDRQMAFCLEIDKQKLIGRQTYLSDGQRKENDAEHAWHLAIMAILLQEYANEELDLLKTVTMLLIHDLVEIDAGDTYAYDTEGQKTKLQRETAAADRIFSLLPEDQAQSLQALWEEFEAGTTPEARFAHTMDNLQPTMLNAATGGKAWAQRKNRLSQVLKRNQNTATGSKTLWDYSYTHFITPSLQSGALENDMEPHS